MLGRFWRLLIPSVPESIDQVTNDWLSQSDPVQAGSTNQGHKFNHFSASADSTVLFLTTMQSIPNSSKLKQSLKKILKPGPRPEAVDIVTSFSITPWCWEFQFLAEKRDAFGAPV
eukprot:Gregarina_sp_Poly_1__491@NODE_111_length_13906_cov_58_362887_g98_i0_p15_GENE_NODE_111_length_13906_cov_58_362887_g98_i0NODE_111_length_13906_cov_58_362887_g98_i0_p15_ORF_typecomplete_len115_score12_24_NODE_111_length_13906_cov_58_362887_g98_i08741218